VACRMSKDLLAFTRFGKLEAKGAKQRKDEAPGMVPKLRFHSCAILLSNVVSSVSVRGVMFR
jgi:hypothetical protein